MNNSMIVKHTYLLALTMLLSIALYAHEQVKVDLDNDGKPDNVSLIQNGDNEYSIQYTLSESGKKHATQNISGGDENKLSVKNNILIVSSQFMRGENYFKFRYDKRRKEIILIGYDNIQYGNATNSGSGNESYNLLTGDYEAKWNWFDEKTGKLISLPTIRKKLPIHIFTLEDFSNRTIDTLYDLGYKYLPKQLK